MWEFFSNFLFAQIAGLFFFFLVLGILSAKKKELPEGTAIILAMLGSIVGLICLTIKLYAF